MKKNRKSRKNRKLKKIWVVFGVLITLVLAGFLTLKLTENGPFTVVDYSSGQAVDIETYNHYFFAKLKMNSIEDNNLVAIKNENQKVVALKQGLVYLKTKEASQNTLYTEDGTNKQGYTNGSYGSDALYLDTSNDGTKVLAMISGVKGWFNVEDIELFFFDDSFAVSIYKKLENTLVHYISMDMKNGSREGYGIGIAPDFMQEDTNYYSYDGNWFYTDMESLSNDVKENKHDRAVNQQAFYNFYQYIPHRSTSTISDNILNAYLEATKQVDALATTYPCAPNESALYNQGKAFIKTQKEYGMNASMLYALALNESGYGQSQYSILNHNFFGHAVYDASPDSANSYTSLEDCLNQHAYYFLQQGFANPADERYHGSWFGNKASGINVQYASDPYWGEKAAYFYYQLDDMSNYKDDKNILVNVHKLDHDLNVYSDKDGKHVLYTYSKGDIVSFVQLEDDNTWFTTYSEVPVENNTPNINASYNSSKAYIKKADLQ